MNESTAWMLVVLGLLAAPVALIITGHGGWVIAALLVFFIFVGS